MREVFPMGPCLGVSDRAEGCGSEGPGPGWWAGNRMAWTAGLAAGSAVPGVLEPGCARRPGGGEGRAPRAGPEARSGAAAGGGGAQGW